MWFPVTHIISEWKLEWCKLGEISEYKQNILSNGRHRPSLNVCLKNQTRVLWSCLAEKNWRNRTVVVLPEEYLPYNLLSRLMPRQKAISSPQALTSEARTVEADLGVIRVKTNPKYSFFSSPINSLKNIHHFGWKATFWLGCFWTKFVLFFD